MNSLVMPMDWAHRHGELYGRGVPGLCTCLIGFVNHPAVTHVFRIWFHYMHLISRVNLKQAKAFLSDSSPALKPSEKWILGVNDLFIQSISRQQMDKRFRRAFLRSQDDSILMEAEMSYMSAQAERTQQFEANIKRWIRLLSDSSLGQYQLRDQEVFSLLVFDNEMPHVKLFPLGLEWICPNAHRNTAAWAEGVLPSGGQPSSDWKPLTQNPCKALHDHYLPENAFSGLPFQAWLEGVKGVGDGDEKNVKYMCGGARRLGPKSNSH